MERKFLEDLSLEKEAIEKILEQNRLDIDGAKEEEEELRRRLGEKEAEIEAMKAESVLEQTLGKFGAKNFKAVKALLDLDGLDFGEDGREKLESRLEKLKAENGFLFESEKAPRVVGPSAGGEKRGFGFKFTGLR